MDTTNINGTSKKEEITPPEKKYAGLLIGIVIILIIIFIILIQTTVINIGKQKQQTTQQDYNQIETITTEVTTPTMLYYISADKNECIDGNQGKITLTWQTGGADKYILHIYDSYGTELNISGLNGEKKNELNKLHSVEGPIIIDLKNPETSIIRDCQYSYWAEIESITNQNSVKSQRLKFTWK